MDLSSDRIEYAFNFLQEVRFGNDAYSLHIIMLWVCIVVATVVFSVMFYATHRHRKSQSHEIINFYKSSVAEFAWMAIPVIILALALAPVVKFMLAMNNAEEHAILIKVTGLPSQLQYEYLDEGIVFFDKYDKKSNQAQLKNYGTDVAVIPINTKISFLFTAGGGECVPEEFNKAWILLKKVGIYQGHCAQLCGKNYTFMPIILFAKEKTQYQEWVKAQSEASTSKSSKIKNNT